MNQFDDICTVLVLGYDLEAKKGLLASCLVRGRWSSDGQTSFFFFYPELADLSAWLCVHISASSVSFLLSSFLIAQTLQCPLLSAAALTSKTSQCVTDFECLHHTLRH